MSQMGFGTPTFMGSMASRGFGKLVKVALPDLGEGTKEATIKEWFVQPGSIVKEVRKLEYLFLNNDCFVL